MYKKISIFFVLFFGVLLNTLAGNDRFTLVIDAGHGGSDAGAIGAFSKEKDINLNISLAFGRYVERNMPDVNVIYTRTEDIFIPLHTRADIANKAKADVFISIHTNSLPQGRVAKGFQVYTLGMHRAKDNLDVAMRENSVISMESDYKQTYEGFNPSSSESYIMFEFLQSANMEKSVELARLIQNSVCSNADRIDKGVHQAGFLVLRESSMPSCLIELGFITSQEEEEFLNSQSGINSMAYGIYKAFADYKKMVDNRIVVPYRAAENKRLIVSKPYPAPSVSTPKVNVNNSNISQVTKKKKPSNKPQANTINNQPDAPVFKVQVFATNKKINSGSPEFKGHKDCSYFQDNGWYKYTIGSSNNYNEIRRLKNSLLKDFPQAYIVAFKNNAITDVNMAIQEFLKNKQK